jgi:hypothetical protein
MTRATILSAAFLATLASATSASHRICANSNCSAGVDAHVDFIRERGSGDEILVEHLASTNSIYTSAETQILFAVVGSPRARATKYRFAAVSRSDASKLQLDVLVFHQSTKLKVGNDTATSFAKLEAGATKLDISATNWNSTKGTRTLEVGVRMTVYGEESERVKLPLDPGNMFFSFKDDSAEHANSSMAHCSIKLNYRHVLDLKSWSHIVDDDNEPIDDSDYSRVDGSVAAVELPHFFVNKLELDSALR